MLYGDFSRTVLPTVLWTNRRLLQCIVTWSPVLRPRGSNCRSPVVTWNLDPVKVQGDFARMAVVFRKAALLLAVLAIVFRGLLPAGWMPNPAGLAESPLILCDMDGLVSATDMAQMAAMDMPSMDMPDGGKAPAKTPSHQDCPFAAAGHSAVAMADVTFLTSGPAVELANRPKTNYRVLHLARHHPQSPRAPPLFSD